MNNPYVDRRLYDIHTRSKAKKYGVSFRSFYGKTQGFATAEQMLKLEEECRNRLGLCLQEFIEATQPVLDYLIDVAGRKHEPGREKYWLSVDDAAALLAVVKDPDGYPGIREYEQDKAIGETPSQIRAYIKSLAEWRRSGMPSDMPVPSNPYWRGSFVTIKYVGGQPWTART